jgi:hypothetical protein
MSLPGFVKQWRTEFHRVAPNAALEIAGVPANRNIALIELGTPHRDASRDTVAFNVKPLKRTSATRLQTLAGGADPLRTGSFGRATLFIDDGTSMQFPFAMGVSGTQSGTGFTLTFDQAQLTLSSTSESTFTRLSRLHDEHRQWRVEALARRPAVPATLHGQNSRRRQQDRRSLGKG